MAVFSYTAGLVLRSGHITLKVRPYIYSRYVANPKCCSVHLLHVPIPLDSETGPKATAFGMALAYVAPPSEIGSELQSPVTD